MADRLTRTTGVVGLYDDVNTLVKAARIVRDTGYSKWDCHTPYPVHGLNEAMGLKPSPVAVVTLTAGFVGLASAVALTGGLSVWQYPIRIGGKALFSWQAFVPIFFELFVLFAAFATLGSVVFLCKLGRWHSPLHDSGVMRDIICNRFAIVIEAADEGFSEEQVRALLIETGCHDVRSLVEYKDEDSSII